MLSSFHGKKNAMACVDPNLEFLSTTQLRRAFEQARNDANGTAGYLLNMGYSASGSLHAGMNSLGEEAVFAHPETLTETFREFLGRLPKSSIHGAYDIRKPFAEAALNDEQLAPFKQHFNATRERLAAEDHTRRMQERPLWRVILGMGPSA